MVKPRDGTTWARVASYRSITSLRAHPRSGRGLRVADMSAVLT